MKLRTLKLREFGTISALVCMALLFSLAAVLIICLIFQYRGGCKYCVPLLASLLYILTRFIESAWIALVREGARCVKGCCFCPHRHVF